MDLVLVVGVIFSLVCLIFNFRILFIAVVLEFFVILILMVMSLVFGSSISGLIMLVVSTSVICLFLSILSSILRSSSSELMFILQSGVIKHGCFWFISYD